MGKHRILIEGLPTAEENDPIPSPETHGLRVNFIYRLIQLPSVEIAISYAGDTYDRLKKCGPVALQEKITGAEETIKTMFQFALCRALPVVNKLHGPINSLDSLACSTLDAVTEKVPLITRKPEEIATVARTYVDEALKPIYSGMRATGEVVTKKSTAVQSMTKSAITTARSVVDDYIPATSDEAQDPVVEPTSEHPLHQWLWMLRQCAKLMVVVHSRLTLRVRHGMKTVEDWPMEINASNPFRTLVMSAVRLTGHLLGFWSNPISPPRPSPISTSTDEEPASDLGDCECECLGQLPPESVSDVTEDLEGTLFTDLADLKYKTEYPALPRTTHF